MTLDIYGHLFPDESKRIIEHLCGYRPASTSPIAELAGISLIAFDIRDSRRQARKILHRDRKVYLSGSPLLDRRSMRPFVAQRRQ